MDATKARLLKQQRHAHALNKCVSRFDVLLESGVIKPGATLIFQKRYLTVKDKKGRVYHDKGPYYYVFWRDGAKMRERYIGKYLPPKALALQKQKEKQKQKEHDEIPSQSDNERTSTGNTNS